MEHIALKLAETLVRVENGKARVLEHANEQFQVLLDLLELLAQFSGHKQLGLQLLV